MPIASYTGIRATIPFSALFEDAIQEIEQQVPKQTKLKVGKHPIVCMTPLLGDADGNIRALTEHAESI